ncbi:MAG TPA: hypothetical protein VD902_15410, partial [Symbiobacteriaceae bacterium]|nr:hypothetical protein [Symbiobacteriaceae bacterium]
MMVAMYVRVQNRVFRAVRRLQGEQKGLTMIEYGVAAAFLVLVMAAAALVAGPKLSVWIGDTIDN